MTNAAQGPYRSGFACFVGRPNVGKSTLMNALVGEKVAITSSKPQTTRHAIRGIVHRDDGQLVLVDTPGLHRPRTLLGERLNDVVRATWSEVDVIGFCLPADEKVGPGDRFIASELAQVRHTPKIAVVTKADLVTRPALAPQLAAVAALGEEVGIDWAHVVPVSAVAGDQLDLLAGLLVEQLPEGPPLYPDGELTDEPEEKLVAELVREAALEGVREELPHSIAVTVDEIRPSEERDDLLEVDAVIHVERESQKGIVIGRGGQRLKAAASDARRELEVLLGARVYLSTHVRVAKEWQRDPKQLGRLGY